MKKNLAVVYKSHSRTPTTLCRQYYRQQQANNWADAYTHIHRSLHKIYTVFLYSTESLSHKSIHVYTQWNNMLSSKCMKRVGRLNANVFLRVFGRFHCCDRLSHLETKKLQVLRQTHRSYWMPSFHCQTQLTLSHHSLLQPSGQSINSFAQCRKICTFVVEYIVSRKGDWAQIIPVRGGRNYVICRLRFTDCNAKIARYNSARINNNRMYGVKNNIASLDTVYFDLHPILHFIL